MTDIKLPELGESVTEGTITRWLKAVGDEVAVDEAIVEISTDKVDTEVPSPAAGILRQRPLRRPRRRTSRRRTPRVPRRRRRRHPPSSRSLPSRRPSSRSPRRRRRPRSRRLRHPRPRLPRLRRPRR